MARQGYAAHPHADTEQVTPADDSSNDGRRIRRLRRRAGLTQVEFASLMERSQAWVSGVETGAIGLDSIELINRAARVLRVDPGEITGNPRLLPSPAAERAQAAVCGIRRVVQRYDLPPDWPVDPRPYPELAAGVAHLTGLRRAARYADLGEQVPDAIREIHAAAEAAAGSGAEELYALLAMAYKEADAVAHNLGHDDLATLTVERIRWAADRAANPDIAAIGDYLRVRDLWANRLYDDALLVIEQRLAAADLNGTVAGSLLLRGAITAARGGSADTARTWMRQAHDLIDAGVGADLYELTFTGANVAIHDVAAAVETYDGARALALDAAVRTPEAAPRSRRARYRLDIARACVYHGAYERAVGEIEAAERLAPLMIRNSPHMPPIVRTLLERRGAAERVRRLASRLNLA
jgi:transcriptional regulator with XRE-family HTH domain